MNTINNHFFPASNNGIRLVSRVRICRAICDTCNQMEHQYLYLSSGRRLILSLHRHSVLRIHISAFSATPCFFFSLQGVRKVPESIFSSYPTWEIHRTSAGVICDIFSR